MSNRQLHEVEVRIKAELEVLAVLASDDAKEVVENKVLEITGLVEQRNQMCKGMK